MPADRPQFVPRSEALKGTKSRFGAQFRREHPIISAGITVAEKVVPIAMTTGVGVLLTTGLRPHNNDNISPSSNEKFRADILHAATEMADNESVGGTPLAEARRSHGFQRILSEEMTNRVVPVPEGEDAGDTVYSGKSQNNNRG